MSANAVLKNVGYSVLLLSSTAVAEALTIGIPECFIKRDTSDAVELRLGPTIPIMTNNSNRLLYS